MTTAEIEKRLEKYYSACYFVWLERGDIDALTNPPASMGEEIAIGSYITKIKRTQDFFKKSNLPIPEFDPDKMNGGEHEMMEEYLTKANPAVRRCKT